MSQLHLLLVSGDLCLLRIGRSKLTAEAIDTASRVDQLLLTGEERMASRADFDDDITLVSRACFEGVAARALDADIVVLRMNSSLWHCLCSFQLPAAERSACHVHACKVFRTRRAHDIGVPVALHALEPRLPGLQALVSVYHSGR